MTFNPSLPVQTRDGREAEIAFTDMEKRWAILARMKRPDGSWEVISRLPTGQISDHGEHPRDLINTPKTHKFRVNIWRRNHDGFVFVQVDCPTQRPNAILLASKEIEITEDDGLS